MENQKLCGEWLNQIERLYGKRKRDKSIAYYNRGWYYIGLATEYTDGSIGGADIRQQSYREKKLIEMIKILKGRLE